MDVKAKEPDSYRDGMFKLVPRWGKCISVAGDCVEEYRYFSGMLEMHLRLQLFHV
jgi:hypothetical protein